MECDGGDAPGDCGGGGGEGGGGATESYGARKEELTDHGKV